MGSLYSSEVKIWWDDESWGLDTEEIKSAHERNDKGKQHVLSTLRSFGWTARWIGMVYCCCCWLTCCLLDVPNSSGHLVDKYVIVLRHSKFAKDQATYCAWNHKPLQERIESMKKDLETKGLKHVHHQLRMT